MLFASHPYAIGDIHGEISLLRSLVEQIPADDDIRLIFLGDYMDRGEDSIGVILYLRELARQRACVFLQGNHDAAWLEVWNGERFIHCPAIPGARAVWERCQGTIPSAVGQFLAQTRIDWEDEYAYYAHAGAASGLPFRRTPAEVKLWGDSRFLSSTYDWGKPVVFGHFELAQPLITQTKIGLDTAAYRTGVLTAFDVAQKQILQAAR